MVCRRGLWANDGLKSDKWKVNIAAIHFHARLHEKKVEWAVLAMTGVCFLISIGSELRNLMLTSVHHYHRMAAAVFHGQISGGWN